MADTLSQIVIANKGTDKQMKEQTSLLLKLYDVQKSQLKLDQEEAKQAARDRKNAKRRGADSSIPGVRAEKKEKKKTEGLLSKLMKGLGGLGGLLKGGGLIAGLGKLILGALGLKGGMKFGEMLIDRLLPKNGKGLMSRIMQGLFGRGKVGGKGIFPKMLDGLFGKGGMLSKLFGGKGLGGLFKFKGFGKLGGKMVKGGGILAALTSGIMEFFDTKSITDALFAGGGAGAGAIGGGILGSFLGPIGTAVGAALGGFIGDQLGKILKDQLDKNPFLAKVFGKADEMFQGFLADVGKYIDAVKETFGKFMYMIEQFGRAFDKFNEDILQPFFKAIGDFVKDTWEKFTDGVQWVGNFLDDTFGPTLKKVEEFLSPILDPLKELGDKILGPVVSGFQALLDFLNPVKMATNLVKGTGNVFQSIGDFFKNYADGKQQGGFVGTVPNQGGNGDRFGAMLSPGSVVLNQTAAGMMQNGGMVPTMLEQGEHVFGPSNPAAGAALAMNSMIPRFQTGGVVQTDGHAHTGSGWQPKGAKDYKGRPVVLSEGGAEAFAKMMKESGGEVKGSDVNSAKRSASYNSTVGGVSNSNHLFGNGLDIQSGSSSWNWMKQNASQHGWHWNDYLGPTGWHWDYTGAKSEGTNPDEGNENGIAKSMVSTLKGAGEAMGSLFSFGGAGTAGGELIGAIGGALSDVFGDVFGSAKKAASGLSGAGYGPAGAGGAGAVSVNDPNGKAILNAIADAEGTSQYANQGYNTQFTGKQFSGKNHPRQVINSGGYGSDAAGRYQFLSTTWDEYANGRDMSAKNQDAVALDLIAKKRGVNLSDGLSKKEVYKIGQEWASVEGGPSGVKGGSYGGQAKYSAEKFLSMYKAYGGTIQGMQTGGVANMRGSSNGLNSGMVSKSQDQFAQKIANASTPIVIPVPSGGGGAPVQQPGNDTAMPDLPSADNSIVAMEYKYRITMGASV